MIYRQLHTPFTLRTNGLKGIALTIAGVVMLGFSLLLLPIVLAGAAITLLMLSLMGRVLLSRLRANAVKQQSAWQQAQYAATAEPEADDALNRFRNKDVFRPRPHQGRTFEHDGL